jgi:hypothetical protein
MGSIALLSSVVIASMLSRFSCCKLSYVGLWSSIMCDVSGPIVDRCWGLSKVVIRWGRLLPLWFVDGSCSNQLRISFLYSHSGRMYDNLILGIYTMSIWFLILKPVWHVAWGHDLAPSQAHQGQRTLWPLRPWWRFYRRPSCLGRTPSSLLSDIMPFGRTNEREPTLSKSMPRARRRNGKASSPASKRSWSPSRMSCPDTSMRSR